MLVSLARDQLRQKQLGHEAARAFESQKEAMNVWQHSTVITDKQRLVCHRAKLHRGGSCCWTCQREIGSETRSITFEPADDCRRPLLQCCCHVHSLGTLAGRQDQVANNDVKVRPCVGKALALLALFAKCISKPVNACLSVHKGSIPLIKASASQASNDCSTFRRCL